MPSEAIIGSLKYCWEFLALNLPVMVVVMMMMTTMMITVKH